MAEESTSPFMRPDWVPAVGDGMRILVVGGSGSIGGAVCRMLARGSDCTIGIHGATTTSGLSGFSSSAAANIVTLQKRFETETDCVTLVEEFCKKAGGIDALIHLSGALHVSGHWKDMPADDWRQDMNINLDQPFFLSRAAMAQMEKQGTGGRIVLNGTESALHGGSAVSFPYAIAKRGTETMVQGLAREGAPSGILVNGIRLGYIASGFHQRWHERTPEQMQERAELVPLKRGGDPDEAAALFVYLLSGWASFITGQMFALTGGDWL